MNSAAGVIVSINVEGRGVLGTIKGDGNDRIYRFNERTFPDWAEGMPLLNKRVRFSFSYGGNVGYIADDVELE
jgi:hypothetical protein